MHDNFITHDRGGDTKLEDDSSARLAGRLYSKIEVCRMTSESKVPLCHPDIRRDGWLGNERRIIRVEL